MWLFSEMEGIVARGVHVPGVDPRDVKIARDIATQDITKLYLMSYYWTILAMTTVGNLPHPTTKVQYFYVIFQLLGMTSNKNYIINGQKTLLKSHYYHLTSN